MSKKEKLLLKFYSAPNSVSYSELERILLWVGCYKVQAKWSHVKFKHNKLENDIILPVHNNDCKDFYKIWTYKALKNNSII